MGVLKCKMCGGALEVAAGDTVTECRYCNIRQTLPRLDNDRRANLLDRAGHFRRNGEFDKAAAMYEQILNEDAPDAEVYWSLVLCRFGIEYVEDPATRKRIPTVNRAQFTSVFDDSNYKSALIYADAAQRTLYEQEANAINEIQKGILAISQKEEPFDIFICYKESDQSGRRTPDSVLAQELYYQLTREGFKVFFSRITLEDKLGTAYEPYIFAALNSAKVMVVVGTRPEYLQAAWVKNEWSRYLTLIKGGAEKVLIPAYKDMDPYDLPDEFSHLQAQDMSKLGFMQDLVHGIRKLVRPQVIETVSGETVQNTTAVAPLLKRAFIFLEDSDWKSADEYCERVLDLDPENAMAYLGKLMSELRVQQKEQLGELSCSFADNGAFQKVVRYGDKALVYEVQGYLVQVEKRMADEKEMERLNTCYVNAVTAMKRAKSVAAFEQAAAMFDAIATHRDAAKQRDTCLAKAQEQRQKDEQYAASRYDNALAAMDAAKTRVQFEEAAKQFESMGSYLDADEKAKLCRQQIKELSDSQEKRDEGKAMIRRMIGGVIAVGACGLVVLFWLGYNSI